MSDPLIERHKTLDQFEARLNLPPNSPPGDEEELQEYLSMDRGQIEKMSPKRAYAISVRLSQYSFYLNRSMNRDRASLTWIEDRLNSAASKLLKQYDKFTKHEMKIASMAREDKGIAKLLNMKTFTQQRIQRFEGLADGIRNLSYVISLGSKLKAEHE